MSRGGLWRAPRRASRGVEHAPREGAAKDEAARPDRTSLETAGERTGFELTMAHWKQCTIRSQAVFVCCHFHQTPVTQLFTSHSRLDHLVAHFVIGLLTS